MKLTNNTINSFHSLTILFILIIGSTFSGCIETGTGSSKDSIHGIELEGYFFPTWSVWLTNDHPSGKPGETGYYSAIYSVDMENKELIEKLKNASKTDDKYVIEYTNYMGVFPWDYSSGVVITDINPLKPE